MKNGLPPLADHRPAVMRALDTLGARYTADGVTMGTIGDHADLDAGAVWLACSQLQHGGFVIATDTMPGADPSLGGDNRRTWSLTELGRTTPLYEDAEPVVTGELKLIDAIIAAYHTTRLSEVSAAAHILSKPYVRKLLDAYRTAHALPGNMGMQDALANAVLRAIYGTDIDPFVHPEKWEFAENIAIETLAALTPSALPGDVGMEAEAWLRAISAWLLANDHDMGLPSGVLDADPLDIADRLAALTPSALSGDAGEGAMAKRTFLTCVSGDGPQPYLKVHFNNLADAHAAHDELLGRKGQS